MKLYSVNAGYFKLDGGAMFGVVPKSLWNKLNSADENNMCNWAMRCWLIEDGNKLILVDNGMGDKQDVKFFGYYFLNGDDSLARSFSKYGFNFDDVTDVVLTHLHFDHCGGSIKLSEDKSKFVPTFKNATYHVNEKHWNWAINPNVREKASFLKENILPIQESGQMIYYDEHTNILNGLSFIEVNGHTEAMMLPKLHYNGNTLLFMADLIPSAAHLPLPYVMGYDVRPLETMKEKTLILNEAAKNNWLLFFEHDNSTELISLEQTEKGVRRKDVLKVADL